MKEKTENIVYFYIVDVNFLSLESEINYMQQ